MLDPSAKPGRFTQFGARQRAGAVASSTTAADGQRSAEPPGVLMDVDSQHDRPIPAEFHSDEEWAEPSQADRLPTGRNPNFVFTSPELVVDSALTRPLIGLMAQEPERPLGMLIELRGVYPTPWCAAARRSAALIRRCPSPSPGSYVTPALPAEDIRSLVELDTPHRRCSPPNLGRPGERGAAPRGAIYPMWPNFQVGGLGHPQHRGYQLPGRRPVVQHHRSRPRRARPWRPGDHALRCARTTVGP
jgi:hypothetical protein